MPRMTLLTVATTAALLAAGSALAEAGASASFSQLDKNNDGQISRTEWTDHYRVSGGAEANPARAMGEPPHDGPRVVDDLGTKARSSAGGTVQGAGQGHPARSMGEPPQGGPRVVDDLGTKPRSPDMPRR